MIRTFLLALALAVALAMPAPAAHAAPPATVATQIIGAEVIAERLTEELALRTRLAPGARLELDNKALSLTVPASAPETLSVESLSFEPRSGRVLAWVAADGERVRVSGAVRTMVELPVLSRYVAPGDVITAGDVERIAFRSDRLNQAVVAEADELVGRTPKRAIRPLEPVRQGDVMLPLVIRKGDLVTIVLETPALRLTAQGKAAEDGSQGATIRVANTKTGRLLEGVVVAPGTIALGTAALATQAAAH
jgi:flagella basal body P-ring formation protein FlgA